MDRLFLWQPGVGDPTWLGWTATLLHLAASGLCLRAARATGGGLGRSSIPWLGLALLLGFLGLNKQLDLQTLLIERGRAAAQALGVYGQRRVIQRVFVVIVTALCAVGVVGALIRFRGFVWGHPLAFAGLMLLVGFVVMRAAAEDHLERIVGIRTELPMGRWVLEIGGAWLIALEALRAARGSPAGDLPPATTKSAHHRSG
jgi:hypothetical protein